MKQMLDKAIPPRRAFLSLSVWMILGVGCRPSSSEPTVEQCLESGELTETALSARKAVAYTDQTQMQDRRCDNCQFWLPQTKERPCGACVIVPGAIAPAGYCTSWAVASSS